MQRQDLERMSREELIAHAERLGIPRPRVLTAPELVDEIIGRTATSERERVKARGWLGRARDLLAQVVEKGLHLPEAARVLRQEDKGWPAPPPPLPTVTLAEIYAAQGHLERAITVLDEVLGREPEHREARALRERFVEQISRSRSRGGRIEVAPPPPPPAKEAPAKAKPAKDAAEKKAATTQKEPAEAKVEPAAAPVKPAAAQVASAEPVAKPAEAQIESAEAAATPADAVATPAGAEIESAEAEIEAAGAEIESAEAEIEAAGAEIEAAEALEEPPLPQRYEVDEVVAIAVDPRTVYLYWEVRATTLAHARARRPDGALTIRVASVTASWEGPVVDTRDLHVDALYGDRFIRDVQPGSNVRVSVGWKSAAGFEPLAVGTELTAPRAVAVESVAQEVARWQEEPVMVPPFSAWRPEAIAEARAPEAFASRPATQWSRPTAGGPHAFQSAPVDTGVAIWGERREVAPGAEPREEISERDIVLEEAWFVAGGASELSRGGPGRVRTVRVHRMIPGAPHAPLGGASELSHGGASELTSS